MQDVNGLKHPVNLHSCYHTSFERFLEPITPSSCPSLIAFLDVCYTRVGIITLDVPVLVQ
jgi:hypothetical protein